MQGSPKGLTVGFVLMLGDQGMFREVRGAIVSSVLLECGDRSMNRYLGNFYLGGKKNKRSKAGFVTGEESTASHFSQFICR